MIDVLALSKAANLPANRGVVPREVSLATTSIAVGGWVTVTSITGEGWLLALGILPVSTYLNTGKWRVTIDGGTAYEIRAGWGGAAGATVSPSSTTTTMLGGVLAISPAVHFSSSLLVEAGHSQTAAQNISATVVYGLGSP